jgi:hypothetical protein
MIAIGAGPFALCESAGAIVEVVAANKIAACTKAHRRAP